VVVEAFMLEVPGSLSDRWLALAREVRECVEAFLGPGGSPGEAVIEGDELPPPFSADLAGGGARLRAAFPRLARRVTAIEGVAPVEIRISCEGDHDGEFYGFLRASGRTVRFVERHLVIMQRGTVAHRVAIDLRAIVRQLKV
jgi:hypothetical protein